VEAGAKVLVVEDTVTTGGSTVAAIERILEEGLDIVATLCVVDRLAGGGDAIAAAAAAPFQALTTIDDVYPDRPDR
jgi:orotate phosphoribosyltransferase